MASRAALVARPADKILLPAANVLGGGVRLLAPRLFSYAVRFAVVWSSPPARR